MYDDLPRLEGNEVTAVPRQTDGAVAVDSLSEIPRMLRDMALCVWRLKGAGLLGMVRTVLRDWDTASCMYVIGNRQYNAKRSGQKEAGGKRKLKGKGGRTREPTGGSRPGCTWNVSHVYAASSGEGIMHDGVCAAKLRSGDIYLQAHGFYHIQFQRSLRGS